MMERARATSRPAILANNSVSRVLGASLLWLAFAPAAMSHGPAPAPLELLQASGSTESFTPSLIRLNIGLARESEGSWVYGCPSQFGDSETARMATTTDGGLLVAVGGGEAYISRDGGCSFGTLDRGDAEPFYTLRASADGDAVWLLAGNAGDSEGAVSRLNAEGEIETTRLFTGGEGWLPDSLVPWSVGDRSGVLVAGASPNPALWRGERLTTDAGTQWTWTSWPVNGLDDSTSFMRVSEIDEAGLFWLVVTDQEGRNLWRGSFTPDAPPALSVAHAPASLLKGPVTLGSRTLAVFDGELESTSASAGTSTWLPLGPVDWTCLDEVGGAVLSCSLTRLQRLLDDGAAGVPPTEDVFLLAELQGPLTTCLTQEEEERCFADWVHYGVEAGLYTPGDPLKPDPEGASSQGGCTTSSPPGPLWLALAWVTWLAWSRRRRAC